MIIAGQQTANSSVIITSQRMHNKPKQITNNQLVVFFSIFQGIVHIVVISLLSIDIINVLIFQNILIKHFTKIHKNL